MKQTPEAILASRVARAKKLPSPSWGDHTLSGRHRRTTAIPMRHSALSVSVHRASGAVLKTSK